MHLQITKTITAKENRMINGITRHHLEINVQNSGNDLEIFEVSKNQPAYLL